MERSGIPAHDSSFTQKIVKNEERCVAVGVLLRQRLQRHPEEHCRPSPK